MLQIKGLMFTTESEIRFMFKRYMFMVMIPMSCKRTQIYHETKHNQIKNQKVSDKKI